MDDPNLSGLIAFLIIAFFRFLNSLLRAGYYGLGRISLLAFVEKIKDKNTRLWTHLEDPIRLKFSIQVFDTLSLVLLVALGTLLLQPIDWRHLLGLLIYLALFDLLLPNTFGAFFPEPLVARLFPVLRIPYIVFSPLTFVLVQIARRGKLEQDEQDEEDPEDIRAFIQAGEEEGIIEAREKPLLQNLLHFNDTVVREVMTPRTDMACVDIALDKEKILDIFRETKFSRIPVYRESIDHIEGVLRLKDLIQIVAEGGDIESSLTEVLFVPENKFLSELMQEMLTHRRHMAIVIDEFGGTAGLTTLEDLIEEIIGEIHDEHESPDSDEVIKLGDGTYLVAGKVLLDDFCEMFHLDVKGDVDTVGGYIFNQEGHIPKVGEVTAIGDLEVTITRADPRRIYQVQVSREQDEPAPVEPQEKPIA